MKLFSREHWTDGPVWEIAYYRTAPGHFDDYLRYIRETLLPQNDAAVAQGLILDHKIFVKAPSGPDDWDIAFATLYEGFARFDYNPEDEAKFRAIAKKHFQTADRDEQRQKAAPRLDWRRYLRTEIVREVNLKPIA